MKKINSTNKIRQSKDGQLYYVLREIIKFNQNTTGFVAIYQEQLFDIIETETGEKYLKIIETYPQVSAEFSATQVSKLFTMVNQPILTTDDFVNKFNELQLQAMLFDTINQEELGRYGTKEWQIYDEAKLLTTA